ncbi:MFS transporter [Flexithrix dorotheae]|uniref:MFS transporter n=1 Tax=Flexithrix dorotheae TaxID=70993 RepID=UPI00037C14D4|nr:MFS transporter [Flexithrix dorotheae]
MNSSQSINKIIVPFIVFSQFTGTSLWFAGNAVISDISLAFNLPESALGHLTSAVQLGFILGTFLFAIFTISDRFSPSRVFFICAICGALANLAILISTGMLSIMIFRAITGFFLAGIYPVGMKIASDYHDKGLGKTLGFLVGALVIGTAFPHLLKNFTGLFSWESVIMGTSAIAAFGGLLILLFVPDGPFRKKSSGFDFKAILKVFQNGRFRAAAFGYFGHMWELYAFWAFVPVILVNYQSMHVQINFPVPFWSFIIIGAGGISCAVGGYISNKTGSKPVAFYSLLLSGICCLISPLIFAWTSMPFVIFLIFWGLTVVSDSPQFSTLVAGSTPQNFTGTALTIVNSVGFFITIFSIQLLNYLYLHIEVQFIFLALLPGPVLGLIALKFSGKKN